jgi:integrase
MRPELCLPDQILMEGRESPLYRFYATILGRVLRLINVNVREIIRRVLQYYVRLLGPWHVELLTHLVALVDDEGACALDEMWVLNTLRCAYTRHVTQCVRRSIGPIPMNRYTAWTDALHAAMTNHAVVNRVYAKQYIAHTQNHHHRNRLIGAHGGAQLRYNPYGAAQSIPMATYSDYTHVTGGEDDEDGLEVFYNQTRSPATNTAPTGRALFLTLEQIRDIFDAAGDDLQARLWLCILFTTGMRVGGLVHIKHAAIADPLISFGKTVEKGGRVHTFPIARVVRQHMVPYTKQVHRPMRTRAHPDAPSPYLFPSRASVTGHLNTKMIRTRFSALVTLAGLDASRYGYVHITRHTVATHLKHAGNTDTDIATFLGHSSAETTRKYYIHDEQDLDARRGTPSGAFNLPFQRTPSPPHPALTETQPLSSSQPPPRPPCASLDVALGCMYT